MKFGFRKPSIKKSIKARTTGRIKRATKKAINPVYGKKGMGFINNPKKAVYNSIYNKTTFGIGDILKSLTKKNKVNNVGIAHLNDNYNSLNQPLDKLIDGKLPFGWVSHYRQFINPRDTKLTQLYITSRNCKNIDAEIQTLKTFINYYYAYQRECKSKGECFYKYFEDMHMHCHNSTDKDFEFVTPAKERLNYLQENYERLKTNENILANVKSELLKIIKNNPGILQAELLKKYDPEIKDSIRQELYSLINSKIITREKSGRSFKLFISNS